MPGDSRCEPSVKIAIISDIQGNAVALEAALEQIRLEQPDAIVSLGDVASGPEPVQVLSLLRSFNCLTVRGNMDDVILHPEPYTGDDETLRNYAEMDLWCSSQLSTADRAVLTAFQTTLTLDLEYGKTLLCCHGSPQSYNDVIEIPTSDEELNRLLLGHPVSMVAVGHMHEPMLRRFGDTLLINPGSIGFPGGGRKLMSPVAEYALILSEPHQITVSFHAVKFDGQQFKHRVLTSGMPHAEWYLSKWRI